MGGGGEERRQGGREGKVQQRMIRPAVPTTQRPRSWGSEGNRGPKRPIQSGQRSSHSASLGSEVDAVTAGATETVKSIREHNGLSWASVP